METHCVRGLCNEMVMCNRYTIPCGHHHDKRVQNGIFYPTLWGSWGAVVAWLVNDHRPTTLEQPPNPPPKHKPLRQFTFHQLSTVLCCTTETQRFGASENNSKGREERGCSVTSVYFLLPASPRQRTLRPPKYISKHQHVLSPELRHSYCCSWSRGPAANNAAAAISAQVSIFNRQACSRRCGCRSLTPSHYANVTRIAAADV